jgi:SagB-type dehydrogenase family enzyme
MRNGKNPNPFGKKRPRRQFVRYCLGGTVLLPSVSVNMSPSLFEVIDGRKSTRTFRALSLEEISNVLWYSAKVNAVKVINGEIFSHRPTPSAGAIHPIDVLISLQSENARCLYYYDPFQHCLRLLELNISELASFIKHVNNCLNLGAGTLIWFLGDQRRTGAFYANPSSLIWRDAGALILGFQLAATALNIGSCAIGTLARPYIDNLFGKKATSAGGLILG